MTLDKLTTEAQSILNELWIEKLIPFQLTAHQMESLGMEEYIVRFLDSRLHSVDVCCQNHHSFKDAFRVAILARTRSLDGPWRMPA